jgi:hypothetical protein
MERAEIAKKVATWTVATIMAALIGATIKTAYDRADPKLSIVQIRTSIEANQLFETSIKQVSVPESLKKVTERTLWSSIAGVRNPFSEYKKFVEALDDNERRMNALINAISSFERDKSKMRELLYHVGPTSEDDVNEFFDLWERNDGYIHGSLRGKFRRGSFELTQQRYDGTPMLLIHQDDDKDWIVSRKGGRYNSLLMQESSRDHGLQEEVAKSLAFFKRDRLQRYLKVVEEDSADIEVAKQLLAEIASARLNISRLSVTVQLENKGATAVSLIPFAEIEVETSGLVQDGKQLNGNTRIQIEYRVGSPGIPTAIHLSPNSSMLVSFSSSKPIRDFPNSEALMKLFELGTAKCRIKVFTAGANSFAQDYYLSGHAAFANLDPIVGQAR